jgi:hypothetical protein
VILLTGSKEADKLKEWGVPAFMLEMTSAVNYASRVQNSFDVLVVSLRIPGGRIFLQQIVQLREHLDQAVTVRRRLMIADEPRGLQ